MKRILISGVVTLTVGAVILVLTGCASTRIKQLSGDEFQKQAQQCNLLESFQWTSYVGTSHQNAYLEYGYPAIIGKGMRTTVFWTPLSELPGNLVAQMKAGTPPWTNWNVTAHKEECTPPAGQSFHVDLQDGFRGDPVQVFVDDQMVYAGKPITDELLGIAGTLSFHTTRTGVVLRVIVPAKAFDEQSTLDLTKAKGIGISIDQRRLRIQQADAFGYD